MIPDFYRLVELQTDAVANFAERADPIEMKEGFFLDAYTITRINCQLWHLEDKSRRAEMDTQRGIIKTEIDKTNQQRHDAINRLDEHLVHTLRALKLPEGGRLYTETLGSIVDRLSILVLRLYHTKRELSEPPIETEKLNKLMAIRNFADKQLEYLRLAGQQQANAIFAGEGQHIAWKSLKLYNDPALSARHWLARPDPAN